METRGKNKEENGGWLQPILDTFFGSVQNFIREAVNTVHDATENFTQSFMRKAFLLSIPVLGIFFLFKGIAEMMSMVYGREGIGEIIVGGFTLLIWAVAYIFHNK